MLLVIPSGYDSLIVVGAKRFEMEQRLMLCLSIRTALFSLDLTIHHPSISSIHSSPSALCKVSCSNIVELTKPFTSSSLPGFFM